MVKKSFLEFFPVPKYLDFPSMGLDICSHSVRFVEIIPTRDGLRLGRHFKRSVQPFENEGQDEAMIKTLTDIQKEYNIRMAHISLPEEKSYFLKFRLPYMRKSEIRESVELQLEEHIPYSPDELVFDYSVISEVSGVGGYIDISVAVLPKTVVESYERIMDLSGITPLSFEVEAESMARSLVPKDYDGTMMIVRVGRTTSVLSIVSRGVVWFGYTMKMGGDFFTRAIMDNMNLSEDDANKLKFSKGLLRTPENQELLFCLAPSISSLRDEIIKHYWYWNAHKSPGNEKDISKILLCGSQASIPGISEYLSSSLGISVDIGNPWVNLFLFKDEIPDMQLNKSLEFSTAIGLALKEEERCERFFCKKFSKK